MSHDVLLLRVATESRAQILHTSSCCCYPKKIICLPVLSPTNKTGNLTHCLGEFLLFFGGNIIFWSGGLPDFSSSNSSSICRSSGSFWFYSSWLVGTLNTWGSSSSSSLLFMIDDLLLLLFKKWEKKKKEHVGREQAFEHTCSRVSYCNKQTERQREGRRRGIVCACVFSVLLGSTIRITFTLSVTFLSFPGWQRALTAGRQAGRGRSMLT